MSKYGGITSYDITLRVGFFRNDDNQVNIRDPIEDIIISEYHTCIWRRFCPDARPRLHVVLQVILARKWLRMQICHKLQKFLGGNTPEPPPCARTQGCSVSRFPLCFGSHDFQIVPARLPAAHISAHI